MRGRRRQELPSRCDCASGEKHYREAFTHCYVLALRCADQPSGAECGEAEALWAKFRVLAASQNRHKPDIRVQFVLPDNIHVHGYPRCSSMPASDLAVK